MSALDDLLSPERLRKRWEQPEEAEEAPEVRATTALEDLAREVRRLCEERAELPREEPLLRLAARLEELIAEGVEGTAARRDALRDEILGLLGELEDLDQAFALGRQR